jgi:hypothetical protein
MTGKHLTLRRTARTTSACCCLALMSPSASAQSGMTRAEAAQLYAAAGYSIQKERPVNRCGKPAKPRVTFVDISGDRRPEALFIDADAECFAPSGRYFAVLAKEGGSWRSIISGEGTIQALSSRTGGWLDMRVSGSGCDRNHRYDGRAYKPATRCAGEAAAVPAPTASPARPVPASPALSAAPATLQAVDEEAAFKAAGFTKRGGKWRSGCDDPGTASYSAGSIEQVTDLNGDGLPEAVLAEGGTYCYGDVGHGFWLVSKLAKGGWKLMTNGTGVPEFLGTKGAGGWPDVSTGGPGFCFPVARWNGREYKLQRWEYDGKPCKPPR